MALVSECSYVLHDPTPWCGVQKTASVGLLGFTLLDTRPIVRLHRGARCGSCEKSAVLNVMLIVPEVETMTFAG